MANKHQQRGGQQDHNFQGSRNQMGQGGESGLGGEGAGQQSAYQDNQGQFGGNYGHDTNYRSPQEYGNQAYGNRSQANQGGFQGHRDNSNTRFGNDASGGSHQETYGNYGLSRDSGYNPRETNANDNWEPENSRGSRGFGHSQSYGGQLGHQDEPQRGSQNWQQFSDRFGRSGGQGGNQQGGAQGHAGNAGHHHDPDYHQWRTEQISNLDNDYKAWRDERYSKFSSEFGEWRKGRKDTQSSTGSSEVESSSAAGNAGQGSTNAASKIK